MFSDWLQRFAQEEGVPAEQTGAEQTDAGEQTADSREHWQQVDRIYDGILAQAEGLRELFPDFDLRREAGNPVFCALLREGEDVEGAFLGANFRRLLPAAMAYAARYTRDRLASGMAGASRPAENGLTGTGAARMGASVSAMSRAEFTRLCRQVEQGKNVSLG